jgi:hypothetical protein
MLRRSLIATLAALPCLAELTACAPLVDPGGPFPIDVSKANSTAKFSINAWPDTYNFYLFIYFKNQAERSCILKLAGFDGDGIPIPIRLNIIDNNGNTVLDEKITTSDAEGYTAEFFMRPIELARLQLGTYDVSASTIQDTPVFAGISCAIGILPEPYIRWG